MAVGSRYKETAEKLAGEKRQRIDVYMPDRVKVKFKGIIDNEPQCNLLRDPTCRVKTISAVSEVKLQSTQEETPINDPYIELRRGGYIVPIKAKHKELTTDGPELMDTLGFLVQLDDTVIVFTGDTTWNDELRDQYDAIKQYCEGKYIISVAHIGGFKTTERDRKQYKNHLGRIGIVELITTLKPDLCLISEFGEEFKGLRVQLVAAINKALRRAKGNRSIILPTDDNFKISIRADKQIGIKVISGINPDARSIRYTEVNPEAVRVGEVNGELYYYSVNNKIKECYYQDALLGHYRGQGLEITGLPL